MILSQNFISCIIKINRNFRKIALDFFEKQNDIGFIFNEWEILLHPFHKNSPFSPDHCKTLCQKCPINPQKSLKKNSFDINLKIIIQNSFVCHWSFKSFAHENNRKKEKSSNCSKNCICYVSKAVYLLLWQF